MFLSAFGMAMGDLERDTDGRIRAAGVVLAPCLAPYGRRMQYGAHLPLIDFGEAGWRPGTLASYVRSARRLGYDSITANDHLVFGRPWLDGIVALASVVQESGDLRLAMTVSLPVVRGPAALAKAVAALDIVSGGRLVLGVGPGSSESDYRVAGVPFDERWPRFEEAVRALRAYLTAGSAGFEGRFYSAPAALRPAPGHLRGLPIWLASWGSDAGLRRAARLGDGWLASAYNTTPAQVVTARGKLAPWLAGYGKSLGDFPCSLATMWTFVTDDRRVRDARRAQLAAMLGRSPEYLASRVLVGSAQECATLLRAYADAGVERVFIWPIAEPEQQLERFRQDVAPLV
jgi:alkanesulfonate monooxygenase SsuD/methylene tetrahydromethanopterin reductase-like flavin-dependent oxidoreductase (luciferase family)